MGVGKTLCTLRIGCARMLVSAVCSTLAQQRVVFVADHGGACHRLGHFNIPTACLASALAPIGSLAPKQRLQAVGDAARPDAQVVLIVENLKREM